MVGKTTRQRGYALKMMKKAVVVLAVLVAASAVLAADIRETEIRKGTYVVAHRSFSIVSEPPANSVLSEVIARREEPAPKAQEAKPVPPPKEENVVEAPAKTAPPPQVAKAEKEPAEEYESKKVVVVRFRFDKHEIVRGKERRSIGLSRF